MAKSEHSPIIYVIGADGGAGLMGAAAMRRRKKSI
jgi:hypothetical protein